MSSFNRSTRPLLCISPFVTVLIAVERGLSFCGFTLLSGGIGLSCFQSHCTFVLPKPFITLQSLGHTGSLAPRKSFTLGRAQRGHFSPRASASAWAGLAGWFQKQRTGHVPVISWLRAVAAGEQTLTWLNHTMGDPLGAAARCCCRQRGCL